MSEEQSKQWQAEFSALGLKQWHAEFESLGLEAVNTAILSGHWRPEKTNAARLWLQKHWRAEFIALGFKEVRSASSSGHWRPEKAAAAQLWLQQEDGRRWKPVGRAGSQRSKGFRVALIKYAVAGILILYGTMRLIRLMSN